VSALAGTGGLVRMALRRDRILLPVWLIALIAIAAGTASSTISLYKTPASRIQAAQNINHTLALVALDGRVYDPRSIGSIAMVKMSGFGAILVAILAIVLVVRHTRAEEETGRLELVGSAVVGRRAPLTAALLVAAGASIILGLVTALALIGTKLPAGGSLAFGLAWTGVGITFAAIAAIAAQVAGNARAASAIAYTSLGIFYVLRAIGDTAGARGPHWLSWLSPIGWEQQVRAYAGNRWWVLLITAAFAVVVTAGAYVLVAHRDLGSGLVPDRPGPAAGAAGLRTPLALAWRLQRAALLGWSAGLALLGLVIGSIASTSGSFLSSHGSRELVLRLGGQKGLSDAFLAAELSILGVIVSAYGIQAAMRLRSEETSERAEPILATGTSRITWALSHFVIAILGSTVILAVTGVAAGLMYGGRVGDFSRAGGVIAGALVQLPAVWVLVGIVMLAFGLAPRLTVAGWAALAAFLLIGELGPILKLSQWVTDISPYAHVPRLPGSSVQPTSLIVLTVLAATLAVAGLVGFRRRAIG
jgi:ABC-2 type transport system permease protein